MDDKCPRYEDEDDDCDCNYCNARTLLELSERLFLVASPHVDQLDYDNLRCISSVLSPQAVQDHLEETDN